MINKKDGKLNSEAFDWAYDKYLIQTLWLRRSLFGNTVLCLLLCASIITNIFLFPLKEKVPYLYAFDHATGEVTKIGKLEPNELSSKWEITRYFIVRYVINYESYDADNIDLPYQQVYAQSDHNVRSIYEAKMQSGNKQSPINLYAQDKYITVHVTSINRLNDNTVDVKFEKQLHDRSSNTTQVSEREAIIKWKFENAETTEKMLERDPLGFKITYYQTSQINLNNEKTEEIK